MSRAGSPARLRNNARRRERRAEQRRVAEDLRVRAGQPEPVSEGGAFRQAFCAERAGRLPAWLEWIRSPAAQRMNRDRRG